MNPRLLLGLLSLPLLAACHSDPILDAPKGKLLASDGGVATPIDSTNAAAPMAASDQTPALAAAPAMTPTPVATLPAAGELIRIQGDPAIVAKPVRVKRDSGEVSTFYRVGDHVVNENLPEGYPAPTPPGMIDLKSYPMVRRAEFRGEGGSRGSANGGFWPLFMHIQRRDIAMTSPVEMDYSGMQLPEGEPADAKQNFSPRSWTMSFLYRTQELGPTGEDGRVVVVDAPPVTVLAIGMTGSPSRNVVEEGATKLREFLASQSTWEAAGDVRGLFYNGPDVPESRKWAEIQVPVRLKK
jgi:hypothetical protein